MKDAVIPPQHSSHTPGKWSCNLHLISHIQFKLVQEWGEKLTGHTWTSLWGKAKDKSKKDQVLNPREGQYLLDSGDETSIERVSIGSYGQGQNLERWRVTELTDSKEQMYG